MGEQVKLVPALGWSTDESEISLRPRLKLYLPTPGTQRYVPADLSYLVGKTFRVVQAEKTVLLLEEVCPS